MKLHTIKWDGLPISKPGLYSLVDMASYHSQALCDGPSISSTGLRKLFLEGPAYFFDSWDGNPARAEQKDARHFILGRAVHHLVLGEPYFAKLFCSQPEKIYTSERGMLKWHGNITECKQWTAARKKEGRSILLPGEIEQLKGMAMRICAHPFYKAGLLQGLIERTLVWRDEHTGIWLKWRPDVIPRASADFGDIKTTLSVQWPDLMRTIDEYGYYQQAALGRWACRAVLDGDMESFTYLFVEKTRPWCVRDVRLWDEDLQRGEDANRAALETFKHCLEKGEWPGPGYGNEGNEKVPLGAAARERVDAKLRVMDPLRHQ